MKLENLNISNREIIEKALYSENPKEELLKLLGDGSLQRIIPEIVPLIGLEQNKYHNEDAFNHTLSVVGHSKNSPIIRWSALLHDFGKAKTRTSHPEKGYQFIGHEDISAELAEAILKRFGYDDNFINSVVKIVKHHMDVKRLDKLSERHINRLESRLGLDLEDAFEMMTADDLAHPGGNDLKYKEARKLRNEIKNKPKKKPQLVSGQDLINLGLKQGPIFKDILNKVKELEEQGQSREEIIEYIKSII